MILYREKVRNPKNRDIRIDINENITFTEDQIRETHVKKGTVKNLKTSIWKHRL